MSKTVSKFLYIFFVFVFIITFGGIGVAALFDKSVVNKSVRTIVNTILEEPEEVEEDISTVAVPTASTPSASVAPTTASPTTTTPAGVTAAVLAAHNTRSDCWVAINGSVYNVSSYSHPKLDPFTCGADNSSGWNAERKHSDSLLSLVQYIGAYSG